MSSIRIRPMSPGDAGPAGRAVLADGWADRTGFFEVVADRPSCAPFVATTPAGEIVGTGVATANGPVGWIGTVWVRSDHRGQGLGRRLTERVIEELEDRRGCVTLVLVASSAGRPLYERLGFAVQTHYHVLDAPAPQDADRPHVSTEAVRPYRSEDLAALSELDRVATGEERGALLASFARPEDARCVDASDGTLAGFLVRAPWGGGATIARSIEAGIALLEDRRTGADHPIRTGLPTENEVGRARLEALGWTNAWQAVRMIRGAALDWEPGFIWGQFNYAIG